MKKKDPKVGTGKKPKEQEGDFTQMKTPKIQSLLNLPLWQMPKQLLVRLSVLISRMLGRFKSLLWWSKEPKSQGNQGKPQSQKEQSKNSEPSMKRKRGRPRKMTRQIQNKLKKVAKGLSKASKTHAKQAKTIQSVLKKSKKKTKK